MKIEVNPQKLILFECQCGWKFLVEDKKIKKGGKYKCPRCGKMESPKNAGLNHEINS